MSAALNQFDGGVALRELFAGLTDTTALPPLAIHGMSLDSRTVHPGELFLACAGTVRHGARFIEQAIANSAAAVALEPAVESEGLDIAQYSVPVFLVEQLHRRVSELAGRLYGHPSWALRVVGVTGTNGKTSVSQFIAQAIAQTTPCGLVGTLGSGLVGALHDTGHTTPDAVVMQTELAKMRDSGARYVAMEVSSHALDQGRVEAIAFDTAIFTNLSHDHLDYHGDMLSYAGAKRRLLELPGLKQALINSDDEVGREWLANPPAGVQMVSYGLALLGDGQRPALYADELQLSASGMRLRVYSRWGDGEIESPLLGRFNAANLLAALGALLLLGFDFAEALQRLARLVTVPGRMERFGSADQPMVVVDFAHTPDALEQVLKALRGHTRGRLWCIFGCGGERDREKRAKMGRIAEQYADRVIVTDDNPRREDAFSIIEDITSAMQNPDAVYINRNRAAAIERTLSLASPRDVILVAGKGHECEQVVGQQRIPYSDRETVARLLGEVNRD
ncbi:MAG: UDP-N-acetylmuramoyl-L-alanyl-D-glutamate--2,6-diaminopimelate ligase [Gammaproteobacteria bacterium]|nr:UDP-N-acetylmuramoyl-L-alanyl-D-glutamate--2,6-diaminopimelate ligase [Gammaproteobacteria bacterium]